MITQSLIDKAISKYNSIYGWMPNAATYKDGVMTFQTLKGEIKLDVIDDEDLMLVYKAVTKAEL